MNNEPDTLIGLADWQPQAVVLANGQFPSRHELRQMLGATPMAVCCDGAALAYRSHFGHLDGIGAVVGDGDSLPFGLRAELGNRLQLVAEQETNDLSKAMRWLAAHGQRRVAVLGATGRREDHTLGNISLLIDYMHQGFDVRMFTDYGVFIPLSDTCNLSLQPGQQLSLFNFGATGLRSHGLAYPLHELTNWWQGTLNEVVSPHVVIEAQGDYLLFVNFLGAPQ